MTATDQDSLDARVAAKYGQDFVDFVNAINAPYTRKAQHDAPETAPPGAEENHHG